MKLYSILTALIIMVVAVSAFLYREMHKKAPMDTWGTCIYTGTSFEVPVHCSTLALLGCTPHPAQYLKSTRNGDIKRLTLSEFIDVEDLKDSFKQVLELCKREKVDHLLIAYLPIYFVDTRALLKERFVEECGGFLGNIAPQIKKLIDDLQKELNTKIAVTLVLPNAAALEKVPSGLLSDEDRIRYSIKQFPRLISIDQSTLQKIVIINNQGSDQNEGIINYLRYEYLFERQIEYQAIETTKKRFHAYK